MFWKKSGYRSTAISVVIHLSIILLLMAFKITPEIDLNEYVTIGFGNIGESSSTGSLTKSEPDIPLVSEKKKNEIEIPKVKNIDETNDAVPVKAEEKVIDKQPTKTEAKDKVIDDGSESKGNFGFELDFGGKGQRKIYSYEIPAYPPGVSKEIDVKLQFTIMADGSVGRIIPVQKADTRLEAVAMNSLRKWRFEALPEGVKGKPQTAVITFPFRLQ
ncbi:MAG: energy transducer TonB [Bacteroidetes bacterium]|nr:energy transducer TonB [Bacteroidota bacterium]